jgi:hypothetical protein
MVPGDRSVQSPELADLYATRGKLQTEKRNTDMCAVQPTRLGVVEGVRQVLPKIGVLYPNLGGGMEEKKCAAWYRSSVHSARRNSKGKDKYSLMM